jgi:ribonucleoside-diphosphate reductase alpha chain
MTNEQAYRQGVTDALALVSAAADTLETSSELLRLRRELAMETLRAVAEEGRSLIDAPEPCAILTTERPSLTVQRAKAQAFGYVGESCADCANFTLVRNGTCLKCETCGSTTGCS